MDVIIGDRWRQVDVPVTFLWGDADAVGSPGTGRRAATQCRDATMIELPEVGHLPWLEDPAAVATAVRTALARPSALADAGRAS